MGHEQHTSVKNQKSGCAANPPPDCAGGSLASRKKEAWKEHMIYHVTSINQTEVDQV